MCVSVFTVWTQTLWAEVCLLSFFGGRKEEVEVVEEVEGGSSPDSLEPCCNSLIETE